MPTALDTDHLRTLRTSRRQLQREVAHHLGISRSEYSRIETGQVDPCTTLVARLAAWHDVPIGTLFRNGRRGDHSANGRCLG